jgi:hypothetical protein
MITIFFQKLVDKNGFFPYNSRVVDSVEECRAAQRLISVPHQLVVPRGGHGPVCCGFSFTWPCGFGFF